MQERWADEMGPRTTELPKWLSDRAPEFDIVIFFTYLYYTTIFGLPAVAGRAPTLFQPTAHLEPYLMVPLFDRIFRLPDGYGFLTAEEADLVNQRFGHRAVEEVIGVGTNLDLESDSDRFRRRHKLGDTPSCSTSVGSTRPRDHLRSTTTFWPIRSGTLPTSAS